MNVRRFFIVLLILSVVLTPCIGSAYNTSTLRAGMRNKSVREMQQALIDLGYLGGKADGIFGNNTENAVRKFQKANKLTVDGLAGKKTLDLLFDKQSKKSQPKSTPKPTATPKPSAAPKGSDPSSLFGGDYTTLKNGSAGNRVTILQNALISLGHLKGKADGKYGTATRSAVISFQKNQRLTADGLAGKKTLIAVEKAVSGKKETPESTATPAPKPTATPAPSPASGSRINEKITPPAKSSIKLLHWYRDIKPSLKSGQHILIYEPRSGLSWTLRLYSLGHHADSEPLTAKDTATMVKAFGNTNTWTQKGVYVRLPNGTWTIGSTHDMPHLSGSIKDNNFNGHLCVHFLRTMTECQQNDPKYGVSNQNTIRSLWKSLTGETISE